MTEPAPGGPLGRVRRERAEATRLVVDLEDELAGIVEQQVAVAPDDEHDAEGSTIGFERARVTALLDAARRVVAELDAAEARIAAGAYGRCAVCRAPILEERMVARPTATTCVACALATGGEGGIRDRRP